MATPTEERPPRGAQRPVGRTEAAEVGESTTDAATAPPEAPETAEDNRPLTFTLKLDPEHPYLAERGLATETIADFGLGYCSRRANKRIKIPRRLDL